MPEIRFAMRETQGKPDYTNPKSELYCDLCLYLMENGYTVRVFNLIHPENSDSWNCIAEIGGNCPEGNGDT